MTLTALCILGDKMLDYREFSPSKWLEQLIMWQASTQKGLISAITVLLNKPLRVANCNKTTKQSNAQISLKTLHENRFFQ